MSLHTFEVRSRARAQMVDITDRVSAAIAESGVQDGMAVIASPHTTAGITIQENSDPDVQHDMLGQLGRLVPKDPAFRHGEGNADSHIKTSLMGAAATIIVDGGAPLLGRWQAVYLCEFDGPRTRTVHVKVVG
jgi:secondary thiamine-phosphate synthase enzyme